MLCWYLLVKDYEEYIFSYIKLDLFSCRKREYILRNYKRELEGFIMGFGFALGEFVLGLWGGVLVSVWVRFRYKGNLMIGFFVILLLFKRVED